MIYCGKDEIILKIQLRSLISWKLNLVAQSCLTLCNPVDRSAAGSEKSMEFSRQEYWNGFPFPSPGGLPDSVMEPRSPALQADSLLSEAPDSASNQFILS